jgi:hypothetical protein
MKNADDNDCESNNLGTHPPPQHTHKRTWSGASFSELAADIFGTWSSPSHSNISPSKPPLRTGKMERRKSLEDEAKDVKIERRKSLEDEAKDFHARNLQFLKEAEKQRARMAPPPPLVHQSPSLNSSFRKRLESIGEEQYDTTPVKTDEEDTKDQQQDDNNNDDSLIIKQPGHGRCGSDEVSVLSCISFVNSNDSNSQHDDQQRHEQLEIFEQQQKEQFRRKKKDIGKKLYGVLDRNVTTKKEKNEFIKEYMDELEKERESLMEQWKKEMQAEREALDPPMTVTIYKTFLKPCVQPIASLLANIEVFIANLPLTIGAVGLSWVTMGTVWFKYMEENEDSCVSVHFHSSECTFPEFPGTSQRALVLFCLEGPEEFQFAKN